MKCILRKSNLVNLNQLEDEVNEGYKIVMYTLLGRNELNNQHSLICNDELFMKDLIAIVDDTMRVEEEQS